MKKKLLPLVLLIAGGLFVGSCSKCVTCDSCPGGATFTDADGNQSPTREYCQKDFDNKEDYDTAVALAEAFGCTCK